MMRFKRSSLSLSSAASSIFCVLSYHVLVFLSLFWEGRGRRVFKKKKISKLLSIPYLHFLYSNFSASHLTLHFLSHFKYFTSQITCKLDSEGKNELILFTLSRSSPSHFCTSNQVSSSLFVTKSLRFINYVVSHSLFSLLLFLTLKLSVVKRRMKISCF